MYCINCGDELKEHDRFCSGCGKPISKEQVGCAKIRCPYCMSTNLQTSTKGFSVVKAATGVILVGWVGLLAGSIGSNKAKIICVACGKTFNTSAAFIDDSELSDEEIIQINKSSEITPFNPIYWVALLICSIIGGFITWWVLS